jgi:hypothetical protein
MDSNCQEAAVFAVRNPKVLNEVSKYLFRLAASFFLINVFTNLVILRKSPVLTDFLYLVMAVGLLVLSFTTIGKAKHPDPDLQPFVDVSLLISGLLVLISSLIVIFAG